ncbi:MAG: hypothetical protein HDT33_11545 [Clostridiales bacterium]|nr:hypothetical protein [Clostridiales bacterium]
MTKYERHPAPEKLLLQITTETVNLLALDGPENTKAAELPEVGVGLIAKAWGLPQEDLEASMALIQRQKELIGTSEAAMPDDKLLEPYDGGMIAELVWGLFETAVRLENAEDRKTIHQLALMLADILDFDDWIAKCGPESTDK